jgi:hypothetical protein
LAKMIARVGLVWSRSANPSSVSVDRSSGLAACLTLSKNASSEPVRGRCLPAYRRRFDGLRQLIAWEMPAMPGAAAPSAWNGIRARAELRRRVSLLRSLVDRRAGARSDCRFQESSRSPGRSSPIFRRISCGRHSTLRSGRGEQTPPETPSVEQPPRTSSGAAAVHAGAAVR